MPCVGEELMMAAPATRSSIIGLTIVPLRQIPDERGAVLHVLRTDAEAFVGFGECYCSEIVPGAVKAWKRHRAQTQQFAVPVGRIRLALYDDREASPSRGVVQVIELGRPDAYARAVIPPGLWYGFACAGDTPALIVNCPDLPHDPQESETRPVDDERIPYTWAPTRTTPR